MTDQQLMEKLLTRPLSRTVEATSSLLKRWYVLERGCMRAIAGWLPAIETQQIKLLLARHLWLDARAADAVRGRILELRYPRRDVDRGWDEPLQQVLDAATNAPDEFCLVTGLYGVVKHAMMEAYQSAQSRSERVGDGPTIHLIDQIQHTKSIELDEMRSKLETAACRAGSDSGL